MHCDASTSIHTMLRSICIASSSMHKPHYTLSHPDPPALRLICMTEDHVRQKIQVLKQDPKFNEVLRLQRLPPRGPQQQQGQQQDSAPSVPQEEEGQQPSTSAEIWGPTPEEAARNVAGQKVLDATYRSANKVFGEEPPLMPGLRNVDIEFNQGYSYQNMEGIIRLIDYGAINGGFVPLSTQQRGACMFHIVRRCISCPREFTNSHLRRMIVSFICSRVEELYPMLLCSISGNYGHIRLSAEEYKRKQDSNQITEHERQEFHEPGPFSIVTYCQALLKPNFYGEELCLRLLSMMFKIWITVLDGDSFIGIRVRHQNTALNVDAILVHISRCHYIALGKFFNCFLLSIFSNPHKLHTMKAHCDSSSSI